MKAKTNALNVIYFRYTHSYIYTLNETGNSIVVVAQATLAAQVTTFAYQNGRFHILSKSNQATIIPPTPNPDHEMMRKSLRAMNIDVYVCSF